MLLFDTSGIEAYVTENNPKYANRIIKQLKAYARSNNFNSSYDPYKAAYAAMPTSASSNHEVKQQYINGHFCYAYKFGITTNGLGIVRSIDFYNKDYIASHPDIVVEKKSKSPDEDKSLADSKALLPTLKQDILTLILLYFLAMQLLTPLKFTNLFLKISTSKKRLFL